MTNGCREVNWDSNEYWQTVDLRRELLRSPLGLDFSDQELQDEASSFHIACYHNRVLVGCVVLVPADAHKLKLRQMAVANGWQGLGIGREIIRFAEQLARNKGYSEIELSARVIAEGFYQRQGYCRVGEDYEEVTIPHCKMTKKLA